MPKLHFGARGGAYYKKNGRRVYVKLNKFGDKININEEIEKIQAEILNFESEYDYIKIHHKNFFDEFHNDKDQFKIVYTIVQKELIELYSKENILPDSIYLEIFDTNDIYFKSLGINDIYDISSIKSTDITHLIKYFYIKNALKIFYKLTEESYPNRKLFVNPFHMYLLNIWYLYCLLNESDISKKHSYYLKFKNHYEMLNRRQSETTYGLVYP